MLRRELFKLGLALTPAPVLSGGDAGPTQPRAAEGGVSVPPVTWAGVQRFVPQFYGSQTTLPGVYPNMSGANPGIDLANGSANWRIDNQDGVLRFLRSGGRPVAELDMATGSFTVSGGGVFDTFAVGSTPSPRLPSTSVLTIDGSTFTEGTPAQDKVGSSLTVTFKGGFDNERRWGQGNPGFIFGANDFVVSGGRRGDIAGITDFIGRLSEVHQFTPGATLTTLTGLQAESTSEATATGSTTQLVKSLQVIGPRVRGGTVVEAYSAYLTAPSVSGTGVISGANETLHVEGRTNLDGDTRIGGTLTLAGPPVATTAAGGAAEPLPPAPAGYLTVVIDGQARKLPYYA